MAPIVPPPAAAADDRPPPAAAPDAPPVLIAGAGPVGLCTALTLARFGVPSVVLEAQAERDAAYFRTTGSKAICFQRDVLDVFDRLGAAERLLAEGTTWTTARTFYREHEIRTVTFAGRAPAFTGELPPWINISQARVEQELMRAAAAEPLVALRFDSPVTGLAQDAGGVTVRTGGAAEGTHRGTHLVGADGARSAVRGLLGIGFPGESYADRFLICDIRADLPFPKERRFYFDPAWNPGRQVLVHQCPDSTWRIDWQVPDDYDPEAEAGSGALEERIRRIVGDRPYEVVWSSVYRFHERCADRLRAGRVFLAGDAAHLYAPFGARGLNSGVQDAENIGWKLAVARRLAGERESEALLDSYASERRSAALENLAVTGATMRFLVPQDEAQWEVRRSTLERAITDPAARESIDSGRLAVPHVYADSPLTSPARPGVGGPVPGAICPDGPCRGPGGTGATRFRRLLGAGFTVLAPDAAGAAAAASAVAGLPVPVRVHALDAIDPDGRLTALLGGVPGAVYVLRPDAHLCAVLPDADPREVRAAVQRASGRRDPAEPGVAERAPAPAP
ncbi:pentachlorophenol monooxygenase/3-(3-hydroxy-phenyl)propionate hydroxylase [Murinocardiopsis flavida]|uniref:Pentachlorophenol monooxygenase/3-(3-hydroxy-phenyl)propionate hydroxylase n=1 Tax=Murinocardiopsis flavida TaxID=645275 RepID=A0A2P8DUL8_9ACTN|nr:FAD-dependent monooxygenase [Murinocardiopsis flavida]PSL00926.1 pentachlorophenol monooxygenase/3-(3-hydroxy-phenyl)propionate hydroxylase [Murinocardiopsis flavida]